MPRELFVINKRCTLVALLGAIIIPEANAYTEGQLQAALAYAGHLENRKMDQLMRDGFTRNFQFSSGQLGESVLITLSHYKKEKRFHAKIAFRRHTLEIIPSDGYLKTSQGCEMGYLHICELKGSDSEECKDAVWQGHGG